MARRNKNPKSADQQKGDRQAFPAARLRKLNPTKQQLAWPKGYPLRYEKFPEVSRLRLGVPHVARRAL
jgi:hypothetical protein